MKNKTLTRTLVTFTLALAFLPALNRPLPLPTSAPGTTVAENAAREEPKPGIQPLNDDETTEKIIK